ncbi:MAG: hypothetical protein RL199_395 [Pseudomonadota bacterium]
METADAIPALRALADATRLQVLRLLAEGPFNVGEMQEVLDLGQSTLSHHLKVLTEAGLLECRREGRLSWYAWLDELPPAEAALRSFVLAHARELPDASRARLGRVFDARGERTRRYFEAPSFGTASTIQRTPAPAVDVLGTMLGRLPADGLVVDLGTGAGRLLAKLRQRARRVIGVDQSPGMLAEAHRRVREEDWRDVELRLGTLEHLPLADAEADAAVAHQVLHHVARPESVVLEAHRVLRPGGTLVIADYLPHEREQMRDEYADLWLGFAPELLVRWFEEAGFEEVRAEMFLPEGDELGMAVVSGKRGPATPALASRGASARPVRPERKPSMRPASDRPRRRRPAAHGEDA